MKSLKHFAYWVLFLCGISTLVWAEEAPKRVTISGVVVDAKTQEPIIGAIIRVKGTEIGLRSDYDGTFQLPSLKPGKYTLSLEATLYDPYEGEFLLESTDTLTIAMQPSIKSLGEVVVSARGSKSSETSLIVAARKAVLSSQAVGAKELSRKGLSNAEVAVTQISGISKQEGVKNIFVRGLGDRYNATSLNGFPLPSDDAEYKNISLALFPSDLIQNVAVAKVMSAQGAGDVGGAAINISSRELEGTSSFSAGASLGFNPSALGEAFYVRDGSSYFGVNKAKMPLQASDGFQFSQKLSPRQAKMPINHDYSVAGGKKFYWGNFPISFYLLGHYDRGYSQTSELIRETIDDGSIFADMKGIKHEIETHQIILGNLSSYQSNYHVAYNLLLVHNNKEYVGDYQGFNTDKYQGGLNESGKGAYLRQQTNENLLLTQQLFGHRILAERWKLLGGVSYSYLLGKEPDRMLNRFIYVREPNFYAILGGEGSQQRFFSNLKQHDLSAKLETSYKLPTKFSEDDSKLVAGYRFRYNKDAYHSNRFSFVRYRGSDIFTLSDLNLDAIYNAETLGNGLFEMAQFEDRYETNKYLHAGFVDAIYSFSPIFTLNLGFRLDYVYQHMAYEVNQLSPGESMIKKLFWLPFLNFKTNLGDHVMRLGLSKTYTLPHTKETAPYEYIGNSFTSVGNANLKPSENYNVDLRWEYYFSRGEMLSVTAFYKYIHQPILRIYEGNAAGYLTYKNLTEGNKPGNAQVAGVELELKKRLLQLGGHSLQLGLSGSYIYSHIFLTDVGNKEDRHTKLEGASPWIFNADLTYAYDFSNGYDIEASVVFNYFSDRIFTIGTQGFENTIEHGVPTLNALLSSRLSDRWEIKLKANNLINPDYTLSRKNYDGSEVVFLNKINKGRQISVGLSYSF